MNKTMTWEILAGVDTAAPAQPVQETYRIQRITRGERRLYTPPPASVTVPKPPADLDLQRLNDSAAKLPDGLKMEFKLKLDGVPDAFYITKQAAGTHWAVFAMHADPLYGEFTGRDLPKAALKWCGRSPWATIFAIAHEVPAWCERSYPNPKRLPHTTLVSDITGLAAPSVDPILYGVMVAGNWWGFVPLAEWKV